jgi:hypothetical protein
LAGNTSPIAFPAAYTSLVRTVFVIAELLYKCVPEQCWVHTVQVANSVAKIFPALRTLRVGWRPGVQRTGGEERLPTYKDAEWDIFAGRTEGDWELLVKRVEMLLRNYCREMGVTPTVPHQFELVQVHFDAPEIQTPLMDAALNLRRKPSKAK